MTFKTINHYLFELWNKFKRPFREDHTRFAFYTGFKVSVTALLISIFVSYVLWIMLSMNNVFFEANGYMGIDTLRQAYFDYILSTLAKNLYAYLFFFVGLFIFGIYIGKILLRPFVIIGSYSMGKVEGKNVEYDSDLFSDFRLLTRFSEFFFHYLDEGQKQKKLVKNSIPPQFSKIHGPVLDRVFVFHFAVYLSILSCIVSVGVSELILGIYENMINLGISVIKQHNHSVTYFFKHQSYIFDSVHYFSIILTILVYGIQGISLYSSVSGAAFGIFSTMRSFMKGNFFARVHLVGYKHIRPYTRMLNKYLDYLQREYGNISEDENNKS